MYKRILALAAVFVLLLGVFPISNAYADSVISVTEMPTSDPDEVEIVKESNGKKITDGTAYFKVQYFTTYDCSGSVARTWYYKTIDGVTKLGNKAYYVATCPYGTSDALFENALGMPTLPLGSIRISEAQAPEGYKKADFKLEGKITQPSTGEDAVFTWTSQEDNIIRYVKDTAFIHNDPTTGSLKIIKKDAHEEIFLSGAGYHILNADGEVVAEGYTNRDGEVTFEGLRVGENYSYQEFKPPMGFELDDTIYPFKLTESGNTVVKEQVNYRREGTIQVKKQDTDGSTRSGAVFLLEYSTDKGSTWSPVKSREKDNDDVFSGGCTSPGLEKGQLTTGTDGLATFTGLRADGKILYRLTETAAPEGMSLIGGSLYVGTLPVESDNIYANDAEVFDRTAYVYTLYVTATDSSLFRLPGTGGVGFWHLSIAMMLMAAPIIITTMTKKRKGECE